MSQSGHVHTYTDALLACMAGIPPSPSMLLAGHTCRGSNEGGARGPTPKVLRCGSEPSGEHEHRRRPAHAMRHTKGESTKEASKQGPSIRNSRAIWRGRVVSTARTISIVRPSEIQVRAAHEIKFNRAQKSVQKTGG
eukprot:COSAG02_NODE_79_length_40228_cov_18.435762_14_plen_137_part_00